jgi:hypothetical protein
MTGQGAGPPKEDGRPRQETATTTTTKLRLESSATLAAMRRRRGASRRLALLDCSCPTGPHADPLACLCTFGPLTAHQLNGWRDAAEHVLGGGQVPLVPIEVRRALYRRGGQDRDLALRLHRCSGAAK